MTLNNLMQFSAIGTHGNFASISTPSNVVHYRCTYHHMLNIPSGQQCSHWFFYALADRQCAATTLRIDSFIIPQIKQILLLCNPQVKKYQYLCNQSLDIPYTLEPNS